MLVEWIVLANLEQDQNKKESSETLSLVKLSYNQEKQNKFLVDSCIRMFLLVSKLNQSYI